MTSPWMLFATNASAYSGYPTPLPTHSPTSLAFAIPLAARRNSRRFTVVPSSSVSIVSTVARAALATSLRSSKSRPPTPSKYRRSSLVVSSPSPSPSMARKNPENPRAREDTDASARARATETTSATSATSGSDARATRAPR